MAQDGLYRHPRSVADRRQPLVPRKELVESDLRRVENLLPRFFRCFRPCVIRYGRLEAASRSLIPTLVSGAAWLDERLPPPPGPRSPASSRHRYDAGPGVGFQICITRGRRSPRVDLPALVGDDGAPGADRVTELNLDLGSPRRQLRRARGGSVAAVDRGRVRGDQAAIAAKQALADSDRRG